MTELLLYINENFKEYLQNKGFASPYYEIPTASPVKSTIFWDVMSVKVLSSGT
jgi:hypothetical protein